MVLGYRKDKTKFSTGKSEIPVFRVKNYNPVTNKDIRKSQEIGYHAGDLGKSEPLSAMDELRHTGHFGTGTYFVGDETRIGSSRANRPIEKVDFSNYNLFIFKCNNSFKVSLSIINEI